jgi:hypothetical protein
MPVNGGGKQIGLAKITQIKGLKIGMRYMLNMQIKHTN